MTSSAFSKYTRPLCLFAAILSLTSASTALADDSLCVNWIYGTPPLLDGSISDDIGWTSASQYNFLNGTSGQHGRVQLTRDSNNIYLSFEINKLPSYDENTQIILLLGPIAADATKDWRIHMFPGSNSGNGINQPPRRIQAWKWNGAEWAQQFNCEPETQPNCSSPSSPVEAKVSAASAAADEHLYRVEVRLATGATGIALPNSATEIKLAFNALRVYQVSGGGITETKADQLNWPTNAVVPGAPFPAPAGPAPSPADILANPARATWGTAVLPSSGQSCAGVMVNKTWINNPTNSSTLQAPGGGSSVTNNLFVQVENTGSTPAGHVLGTIRAYRFGSAPNQSFAKVGPPNGTVAPNNPVGSYTAANPAAIAAGTTRDLVPMAWTLTSAQYQALYSSNRNVCSMVELDVDPSHVPTGVYRTQIANRYFYWNILMSPASVFRHEAILATEGYEAPAVTGEQQRFELLVSRREVARAAAEGPSDVMKPGAPAQAPRLVAARDDQRIHGLGVSDSQGPAPGQATLPVLPFAEVRGVLERLGGLDLYHRGARFAVNTVCPYRHTGRYIRIGSDNVELMERALCYEYWVHHLGPMKGWAFDLAGPGLVDNGQGRYSIAVPVGQSVGLTTQVTAVEAVAARDGRWWLVVLLLVGLLVWAIRSRL